MRACEAFPLTLLTAVATLSCNDEKSTSDHLIIARYCCQPANPARGLFSRQSPVVRPSYNWPIARWLAGTGASKPPHPHVAAGLPSAAWRTSIGSAMT